MLSTLVALAVTVGPQSLEETPEWKAFQAVLAKAGSYAVTVVYQGPPRDKRASWSWGLGAMVAGRKDGMLVVDEGTTGQLWDGKAGVGLDHIKKSWRPITELDDDSIVFMFGLPRYGYAPGGTLSRLTRTPMKGGKAGPAEVGWEVEGSGRDYTVRSTLWFDPKSHLITGAARMAWGNVGDPGAEQTFYVHWDLDPKDVDWSTKPPAGFTREGS